MLTSAGPLARDGNLIQHLRSLCGTLERAASGPASSSWTSCCPAPPDTLHGSPAHSPFRLLIIWRDVESTCQCH